VGNEKCRRILAALVVFCISWALALNSDGQVAAPSTVLVSLSRFPIVVEGGDYELVSAIQDFPAGAGVASHKHGGHVLVTVVSGEMVVRDINEVRVVKAGESWTVNPGYYHAVMNAGPETARIAMSVLLPKGAEITAQAR